MSSTELGGQLTEWRERIADIGDALHTRPLRTGLRITIRGMFHYERESRTASSECFLVENEAGSRARVDLHFAGPLVYATLCVPESWGEADIQDVIADVDDRWALTADPMRADLIVTVWRGQEVGVYSQQDGESDA